MKKINVYTNLPAAGHSTIVGEKNKSITCFVKVKLLMKCIIPSKEPALGASLICLSVCSFTGLVIVLIH